MTRLLPALLVLCGCYSSIDGGPEVSETRSLPFFSRVRVQDGLTVHFSPGDTSAVEISTQQKVLENLETTVKGSTLTVRLKPGVRVSSFEWTDVHLTGASVSELNASGGSTLIAADLDAESLTLAASGGSHVENSGTVKSLHLEVSGGSTAKASAQSADLEVSGGSSVELSASRISGEASGGSTVTASEGADLTGLILSGGSQVH